jgi:hypothetical protein
MIRTAVLYGSAGAAAAAGAYLTNGVVADALAVLAALGCAVAAWVGLWAIGVGVLLYKRPPGG